VRFQARSNEVLRPAYVWNRYKSQAGAADFREGLFQAKEVLLIFVRAFFKRCFSRGPFELLKDLSDVSSRVCVCVCVYRKNMEPYIMYVLSDQSVRRNCIVIST
jgi:hypothetical protein